MIVANTRVTILRGGGTDQWGDSVEADRPVATRVPAAKMEIGRARQRDDSDVPGTVRNYRFRFYRSADVRDGDRIRDERDNQLYLVDQVVKPTVVLFAPPLVVAARLVRETTNEER